MHDTILRTYLNEIELHYKKGIATEHTYRGALQKLLENLGTNIAATNEPKRIKCGAPDYLVERTTNNINLTIGYVEAKDIGISLDTVEKDEQLSRYRRALDNLILTDYLEFRWYVNGEKRMTARLATPQRDKRLRLDKEGDTKIAQLLQSFLEHSPEPIRKPQELAVRMARLTHMIRDIIIEAFAKKEESDTLKDLYEAFQEVLLPDLTEAYFADMFAQTLAYGLFAARYNHKSKKLFNRDEAAKEIPRTNPFLRKLFSTIVGPDLDDEPFIGFVDELAQVLAFTDMDAVLTDFGKSTRQEDPIVHFYETFLTQYNPKLRELRGVYYTPEPVVSYIVRSIDQILRTQFGCADGLADISTAPYSSLDENNETQIKQAPRVLILDPATGTGTFLYSVISLIRENYRAMGNAGMWSSYVHEHLLKRLFGFELLMAPYAMAHLKLSMQLAAIDLPKEERGTWAYKFETDERLGVYLTNTLDEALKRSDVMFGRYISDEANEAAQVKQNYPVMVILGNPPYSGISANKGTWIETLMQDYKLTIRSEERQIQRVSNDYVKFIRFAQWRLEKTGRGILGFITDNGYLNGILFRDMRHSLLKSYSHIYILNLHGVSMRGAAHTTIKDENVFDITQGVAIGIFVKADKKSELAQVYYASLEGERAEKYRILNESDILHTSWQEITPKAPHWRMIPEQIDEIYDAWPSFTSIIGTGNPKADRDTRYGTGIKTRHDDFVIGWSPEEAVKLVTRIAKRSESDQELMQELNLCKTAHFNIKHARKRAEDEDLLDHVHAIAYRPFDLRYLVYLREFVCEPKYKTMQHLLHSDNLMMAVLRRDRKELGTGFFVSRGLIAKDLVSNLDDALIWPLYIYPHSDNNGFFATDTSSYRQPNLSPTFLKTIAAKLNMHFIPDGKGDLQQNFGPDAIFSYMYALFHSPLYRKYYAEFLKMDFPRLPLTTSKELFRNLCLLGDSLIKLHLMEKIGKITTKYPVAGSDIVEKIDYTYPLDTPERGRIWINKTQYFENIAPTVWEFYIGAYPVCQKWLKSRKDKVLSFNDIKQYQIIVAALTETIALMEQIDDTVQKYGGWPIQ